MPLAAGGLYSWTLDSSGSERLPDRYVRFANPTTASAQTFTDDIILDQTPPTIGQATLLGEGTGSSAAAVAAAKRKFTVRLRARDNASGVGKAQVARREAPRQAAQVPEAVDGQVRPRPALRAGEGQGQQLLQVPTNQAA